MWKFGFDSFSEKVKNFTQVCIFLLLWSNIDFCVCIKPQRETEREGERGRERGRVSVCLCTWDTEEEGEEDGRMEGWKAGHQLRTWVCLPGKVTGLWNLSVHMSVTALALLRGIFYTFVCYTEAALKKPNTIVPFNHPTWVDRGQLDGSWALRQGGFLV